MLLLALSTTHTSMTAWSVISAAHRAALAGRSSASTLQALWCNCASTSAVHSKVLHTTLQHHQLAAFAVCQRLFVPRCRCSMFHQQAFSVARAMAWELVTKFQARGFQDMRVDKHIDRQFHHNTSHHSHGGGHSKQNSLKPPMSTRTIMV